MKATDLFGVVVRAAGGWYLLLAIGDLYYIFVKTFHLPTSSTLSITTDYVSGTYKLVLGLILLLGANWIVRLAYWREPRP
jgi:hypothetical protein